LTWILIAFLISVALRIKLYKRFLTRWIIFAFLIVECFLNSLIGDLSRMNLYTLEDPVMFAESMPEKKIVYFAYLYNKHGERDVAIFLLSQGKQNIRRKLNNKKLTKTERYQLVNEFYQVDSALDLLGERKWVIKDKFTE
jgi:hypothetical protein